MTHKKCDEFAIGDRFRLGPSGHIVQVTKLDDNVVEYKIAGIMTFAPLTMPKSIFVDHVQAPE